jgi:hypothetical protein
MTQKTKGAVPAAAPARVWKRDNAWSAISPAERESVAAYCRDYVDFLSVAKTEREAFALAVSQAQSRGFVDLDSLRDGAQRLKPGMKVYRGCRGKTLLAAVIGKRGFEQGLHLVGGHTDAPRLDAKPVPLYQDGGVALLDTHYYGGIKKYQWVAMPLALHGVVVRQDGTLVQVCIGEDPADPVFTITDLLPHLGKEQGAKTLSEGINGEGLNVLLGSLPAEPADDDPEMKEKVKLAILRLLEKRYGIEEQDFASAELEIVPAGPARDLGLDQSLELEDGRRMTALDLQWQLLSAARDHAGRGGLDVVGAEVVDDLLARWETVLSGLESDPFTLADQLDWVAKLRLFSAYRERHGIEWGDARLVAMDLQYHDLRPASSLARRVGLATVADPAEVRTAVTEPPADTRAFFRGRCLERFADDVVSANWDSVVFDVGGSSLQRVPTPPGPHTLLLPPAGRIQARRARSGRKDPRRGRVRCEVFF